MTVYNLCFCSLQTCHQEEPWSGMIAGLPRPEDFYHQHYRWLHCYREGLLCPELSSCPHSYPASQIPNEWSRKTDTGQGHSFTLWPQGRQLECFPTSGHYCADIFSFDLKKYLPLIFSHILNPLLKFQPHISLKPCRSLNFFFFFPNLNQIDPGSGKKFSPSCQYLPSSNPHLAARSLSGWRGF